MFETHGSSAHITAVLPSRHQQAQQSFWVPTHIRACSTTTGAVVLDLRRSRYFGIGANELNALMSFGADMTLSDAAPPSQSSMSSADIPLRTVEALIAAGLLAREPPIEAALPSPRIDLNGTLMSVGYEIRCRAPLHAAHLVNFLQACAWAWRAKQYRTLYEIVREISAAKSQFAPPLEVDRASELACTFRRLRPLAFAAREQCLFHALALVKFLSFYRIFPTWVIGVQTRPWSAHSWVQTGNLLLDANPEHVCEYTPILTI